MNWPLAVLHHLSQLNPTQKFDSRGGILCKSGQEATWSRGPVGSKTTHGGHQRGGGGGDSLMGASWEGLGASGGGLGASWSGLLGACWHKVIFEKCVDRFWIDLEAHMGPPEDPKMELKMNQNRT